MSVDEKKLSRAQQQMMKSMERFKLEQLAHSDRIRRRSNIMAFGLFALVAGIYTYTIRRMGQDNFLDDDEPLVKQKLT